MPNFERELKTRWTFALYFVLVGLIIAILAVFGNVEFAFGVPLSVTGVFLVLKSKMSEAKRTKKSFSWASDEMTTAQSHQYWFGYILLANAIAIIVCHRLGLI